MPSNNGSQRILDFPQYNWGRSIIAEIIVAKHAGFCFGVRRAVDTAAAAAPAYTLGPIIHNPQMVAELERSGVVSVD